MFDAFCDGDEDCATADRCMAGVFDIAYLVCQRADRVVTCDGGAGYHNLCSDLSDCPDCATECTPSTFADTTTPSGYGVNTCKP